MSKWRKTKQQKLICTTAPTVRSHTGHLSVSQHSKSFLRDIIGLCLFISALTISLFVLNQCANAVEATSSQIMELLERESQRDQLKREARSLSESYGAVPSRSKSLLKRSATVHSFKLFVFYTVVETTFYLYVQYSVQFF